MSEVPVYMVVVLVAVRDKHSFISLTNTGQHLVPNPSSPPLRSPSEQLLQGDLGHKKQRPPSTLQ